MPGFLCCGQLEKGMVIGFLLGKTHRVVEQRLADACLGAVGARVKRLEGDITLLAIDLMRSVHGRHATGKLFLGSHLVGVGWTALRESRIEHFRRIYRDRGVKLWPLLRTLRHKLLALDGGVGETEGVHLLTQVRSTH